MAKYPEITLDITIVDGSIDIVAEGFDAGIGAGALIAKDMIALRLVPDTRMVVLASPAYLRRALGHRRNRRTFEATIASFLIKGRL
jgi:hypothetical protein